MDDKITLAEDKVKILFNSPPKNLGSKPEKDIEKKQGVYLIYKKDDIIYCGKSKNLMRRIVGQHLSTSDNGKESILRKKLNEDKRYRLQYGNAMQKWIKNNCFFSLVYETNFDICNLIEALSIIQAREKSHKYLLNAE